MSYGHLKAGLSGVAFQRLVAAAMGPGARVRGVAHCRGGLFNTSYRVRLADGRAFVLRVAPPGDRAMMGVERALMRREVLVTRWMGRARLPVADVLHADFSHRLIPRDWVVVSCEPGSNWHYQIKRLSDRENDDLSAQLGAMARRIHGVENPQGWFGYPRPFVRHAKWSGFVRAYAASLERDMRTFECEPLPEPLRPTALVDGMVRILDEIRIPRLVHGDLWPRNILFEREGGACRITALLDCDRGLWGDPRFEWVLYGYPFRPAFWRAYGPRVPATRSGRLRNLLYMGCGALQASIEEWAHFRHRRKAAELLGYATRDLGRLKRDLPGK